MTDFTFVIPDPSEFISGGNSYNRQLIDAIHQAGGAVTHMTYEQFKISIRTSSRHIIDTIYFENFRQDGVKVPDGSIGLIHHLASLYPLSEEVFKHVDLPVLRQLAAFVVSSQFTRSYLQSHGLDKPIIVVEPALKTAIRSAPHRTGKLNAIMVNNIVPRKGLLPFLEAIALEQIPPYYRIQIVGDLKSDADYAQACMETVLKDPLLKRTVQFLGSQDDLAVAKLYARSNLFISASYMETFGMSVQEASNIGLPLLVLEGGNTSNHVEQGINGWVENSMTNLAKRLDQVIAHPDTFIEIQQQAFHYRHPYMDSYQDGAELLLEFTKGLYH